jgi:hypothetical protein
MLTRVFGPSSQYLAAQLQQAAASGKAVNMEACFSQLTLDIIGKSVFNYDFNSLTKDSPLIQAVYTALKETEQRATDLLPLWKVCGWGRLCVRREAEGFCRLGAVCGCVYVLNEWSWLCLGLYLSGTVCSLQARVVGCHTWACYYAYSSQHIDCDGPRQTVVRIDHSVLLLLWGCACPLVLVQFPFLAPLIPRQRKALAAVELIRTTTNDLIKQCKEMVDEEEMAAMAAASAAGEDYLNKGGWARSWYYWLLVSACLGFAGVVFALPEYWVGTVGCLGCRGGAGCQVGVVLYEKALGTTHHVWVVVFVALCPSVVRPVEVL